MEKGKQLIIDCWECPSDRLDDIERVKTFLSSLPGKIGMTRISEPMLVQHKAKNPHDDGITGCVFLAESHAAIHTFPSRGYVGIDVYSCKPFDSELVIAEANLAFAPKTVDRQDIERGVRVGAR